jgi:hypothetical protein
LPQIAGTGETPYATVVSPDHFYQAGVFTSNGQLDRLAVRAIFATGAPDPSFGDGGVATFLPQPTADTTGAQAFSALLTDAGLVLGGSIEVGDERRSLVLRINVDGGGLDNSFGADGVSSIAWVDKKIVVRRLALQGDRVIAAAVVKRLVGSTETLDVVLVRYLP